MGFRLRQIGIFGGTFDPVHIGHLRSALELKLALNLDEVRFMPARVPPHRVQPAVDADTRAKMVELAIQGVDGFVVDRSELSRTGASYTVDTLRALHSRFRQDRLVLLLGTDAFLGLSTWRDWRQIFKYASIAVAHRPGWSLESESEIARLIADRVVTTCRDFIEGMEGEVLFLAVTQLEISATAVRKLVVDGQDVRYLVPEAVCEFIEKTGCYKGYRE